MSALLTNEQAAARLGVSLSTLYTMLNSGQIKGVRQAGKRRFREEDVEDARQRREAVQEDVPAAGQAVAA